MSIFDFFRRKNKVNAVVKKGEKPVVGLVVTTFDKGGLEQVVLNLYNGYKQNGLKVFLLCQENILGIMAKQIQEDELFVFNNSKEQFFEFIYKNQITVLHYHYNIFACDEMKEKGIKTIYTMHNVYTWKNDGEIRSYSEKLHYMDKVVAVSNLVKNYYCARTDVEKADVDVVYNGIDFDELFEAPLPERLSRDHLGLKADDITLGFVASFYPSKYQLGIVNVMEKIEEKNPHIKMLFIGNTENEYFDKFMKIFQKSKAKNMILVPYFEHKYMGDFLKKNVDIFTLPTLQEGCSNAVLEAAVCQKPMVLTDVGNASDMSYLKSCVVVKPAYDDVVKTSDREMQALSLEKVGSNAEELVQAYLHMAADLDKYNEWAKISDDKKDQYRKEYMVNQYIDLIQQIF